MKATQLLKDQHREVKELFRQVQDTQDAEARRDLMEQISERLQTHMMIEESIFYPAVQEVANGGKNEERVPEAYEEHHVVKLVLDELPDVDPMDERFTAKMTVLSELVDHHVQEEEKELFTLAEKLGKERLEELGNEMEVEAGMSADEEAEEDEEFEVDDEAVEEEEDEDDEAPPAHK
jgi:iron-sulfur cluster repair protein YtfE (RIC family)